MPKSPILRVILALAPFVLTSCSGAESGPPTGRAASLPPLTEDASAAALADHIAAAQAQRIATADVAAAYPQLNRQTAYLVQLETLDRREEAGERVVGWKMGGTRITDPEAAPDPLFGYSLDTHVYTADRPLPASDFVGAPEIEAEVAVFIGSDLPGPEVTRDELIAAISEVGGAVEILSKRLAPSPPDDPSSLTTEHAVADNLSHGGVILGEVRRNLSAFDFDAETARILINGEEAASGSARDIMGSHGTVLDAVLWLANELPRHGHHLKSGDYVVTGSLYANPTVRSGDHVVLEFSSLGTISFTVE